MGGWTHTWGRSREEDQGAHVRSTLIAERTGSDHESADAIRLQGASDKRRSPSSRGTGGLLGLEKFLLAVCSLGAAICIAKYGSKDSKRDGVVENGTCSNGRGLDRGKIYAAQLAGVCVVM